MGKSLNHKMLLIILIFLLFTGSSFLLSLYGLTEVRNQYEDFVESDVPFYSQTKDIYALGLQRGQAVRNLILNPQDEKALKNFQAAATDSLNLFEELLANAEKYGLQSEIESLHSLTQQDIQLQEKAVAMKDTDREGAFQFIVKEETPVWRQIKEAFFALEENVTQGFKGEQQGISDQIQQDLMWITTLNVIILLFVILLYFLIRRFITWPIVKMSQHVRKMAEGDLTMSHLAVSGRDEIAQLSQDINGMTENFHELVANAHRISGTVAASADQVAQSVMENQKAIQEIALQTESIAITSDHQIASFDESSHAMEEMAQGIQKVAESSSIVAEKSNETNQMAHEGEAYLKQVVEQMDKVKDSTQQLSERMDRLNSDAHKIGEIVHVIANIASQTNLLALNASIEAARAGEEGKGFAVVASEVKKLATESEHSAKQIDELINTVQTEMSSAVSLMKNNLDDVQQGSVLVENTGEKFVQILQSIRHVALQIEEVSAAAEEMSAGSEEMSATFTELTRITKETSNASQNVAATTEEQQAAMEMMGSYVEELNQVAHELQALIQRFKVHEEK